MNKEIMSRIKNIATKKTLESYGFASEFYQIFEEWILIFLKLFQKSKRRKPNSFYKANFILMPKPDKDIRN